MFSQQYLPYISAVSRIGKDSQTSCRIVALAVAAAVAATLPLPSASVDSPVAFFQAQGAMEAQQRLGEYNEAAVVDCRLAIDLVQKFWMLRYNTAQNNLFLQPYAFYDVGRVWDRDNAIAKDRKRSLSSAGMGLRFSLGDHFSGSFEAAQPLTREVATQRSEDPRYFFTLAAQF
jgi:hypothetical protein